MSEAMSETMRKIRDDYLEIYHENMATYLETGEAYYKRLALENFEIAKAFAKWAVRLGEEEAKASDKVSDV